jgi:hypothetical protein
MRYKRKKKRSTHARQYPMRNKHHLSPKSRNGTNDKTNILLLRVDRHEAMHTLFGNRTLEEIIVLLIKIHRRKRRCTKRLGRCLVEETLCSYRVKKPPLFVSTAQVSAEDTLRMRS